MTADPLRRTALASLGEVLRRVDAREAHLQTQVSVRVAAELATGLELPTEPNTWSRVGAREALWLGPDEWLVVSDMEPADAAVRDLRSRVAGHHASIVDVSAGRAVIELAGDGRLDLLSAGCGLDLYPRSWRPGMCAQTLLARVTVLVQERDNATRVFLRPSYAGYFVAWLAEVTGEE